MDSRVVGQPPAAYNLEFVMKREFALLEYQGILFMIITLLLKRDHNNISCPIQSGLTTLFISTGKDGL